MNVPDYYFDGFEENLNDPRCVQRIYEFSLRQVRGLVDYNDEDDVIQEVFYRLTKWPIARKKYNSSRHYFSLLRITIRQAIAAYWKRRHSQRNDVRKRSFISELQDDEGKQYEFAGKRDHILHHLHLRETAKLVLEKVSTLKPIHREMFELRFVQEKSHDEISEILKVSIRTSYRLETKVRQLLQDYLGQRLD